jgi:hypothetical protein
MSRIIMMTVFGLLAIAGEVGLIFMLGAALT